MSIYGIGRFVLRIILRTRKDESIADSIVRYRQKLRSIFYRKQISLDDFANYFKSVNICSGDTVIIHSSWRGLYNLDATPNEVLEKILSIVGTEGTVVMPCYGDDDSFFDIVNTVSKAGVLTEVFRKHSNVQRSCFPKFSMCAWGKYASEITCDHINSRYQFDEHSPYYIAIKNYDAKIVLLGLNDCHHKITAFHCSSYQCVSNIQHSVYSKKKEAIIINKSGKEIIKYYDRIDGCQNNNLVFRQLYKKLKKEIIKQSGFEIVSFSGVDAYNVGLEYCIQGGTIYK